MRALAGCIAGLTFATSAAAQTPTSVTKNVNTPQRETVAGTPNLQILNSSLGDADLCIGEVSGAYGNSVLAVTIDLTHRDKVCSLLRQAKLAEGTGEPDLAREIMCESPEWRSFSRQAYRPPLHRRSAEGSMMETHFTLPVLIISMRRKFHSRLAEWLTSLMAISWGVELVLDPGMFGNPFFMGFQSLAPQRVWAVVALLIGFIRVSALVINGHARFTPHVRSLMALVSFLGWIAICFGFHEAGRITLGMVIYPWLAAADFYSALRAASDAAIADKDAHLATSHL